MPGEPQELLRKLPAVEALCKDPEVAKASAGVPRRIVVESARSAVARMRKLILERTCAGVDEEAIRRDTASIAVELISEAARPHYARVINATGIILHTGLGRAVLAESALDQIRNELAGYSLLQLETEGGKRSKRDERIEYLLKLLTGCEAATVVNNNASATMLVLTALAKGREVIVSRGQLVEIGGSFRLPDVMAASGATLVEVGTTNKTHPKDYERAITPNTAAILRVHPSNYKIVGFSEEVPLDEMVNIAHDHKLPLIDDVGAGALVDFSRFGFAKEPTLPESVAAGADIILSSADKLIGASQGGIILGRAALVEAVRKNPIARMVRVGKLTLAALEATLTLFLDESLALEQVPTLRMLRRPLADISASADRVAASLKSKAKGASVEVVDGFSQMGSGSLPEQNLATRLVAVKPGRLSPDDLAQRLRDGRPAVFARIQKDTLLIDPRTLLEGEEEKLVAAVASALGD